MVEDTTRSSKDTVELSTRGKEKGEGRKHGREREKSFEARFFFGRAGSTELAKREERNCRKSCLARAEEARPNRKRGAPLCRLSETRYYYYSENGEGNSESRPDQLFLFSFFFSHAIINARWIKKINYIYIYLFVRVFSLFLFPRTTIRGESEIAYRGLWRVVTLLRIAIFKNRLYRAPR